MDKRIKTPLLFKDIYILNKLQIKEEYDIKMNILTYLSVLGAKIIETNYDDSDDDINKSNYHQYEINDKNIIIFYDAIISYDLNTIHDMKNVSENEKYGKFFYLNNFLKTY